MSKDRTAKRNDYPEKDTPPKLEVRVRDDNWEIVYGDTVTASGTIEFDDDDSAWATFDTPVNSGHLSIVEPLVRHMETLRKGMNPDRLGWYA